MTQVRTFERVRSLTPLIPDMLRSSFLPAEAAMALTSEHASLESSVLEITLPRHGAPEHWKKTMRAEVCSSIQGTKSKDEKDRGGHCKKLRWTPQNACLGIVAVDTAKNAEDGMVRMGRMGVACLGSGGGHRKAHEDARNQQQSSFHGNNAHGRFSAKPCLMCSKPIDVAIEQQHPLPDAKARQRLLRFELLEVSALTTIKLSSPHAFTASVSTVSRGLNRLQSFSPRSILLLL